MRMKIRCVLQGAHYHCTVFTGPDVDHYANCGSLVLREAEFEAFQAQFTLNVDWEVRR